MIHSFRRYIPNLDVTLMQFISKLQMVKIIKGLRVRSIFFRRRHYQPFVLDMEIVQIILPHLLISDQDVENMLYHALDITCVHRKYINNFRRILFK